ncbi:MAG: histidine phosphatase family protein [Ilumatobacteraceae bacterium]
MATDATPDESVDPVDPVESVELVLVRHGQSVWNAVRRWQGTADPPLTDLGREQARAQADWLAGLDETWAGVWTSPLRRAATTAEIIATRLGLPAPIVDQRLEEAYAGDWEGMTPAEIEHDWPGYLTRNARPPSFEPDPIVRERAWSSLSDVVRAAAGRGSALVVTHSGLMRRVSGARVRRGRRAEPGRLPPRGRTGHEPPSSPRSGVRADDRHATAPERRRASTDADAPLVSCVR